MMYVIKNVDFMGIELPKDVGTLHPHYQAPRFHSTFQVPICKFHSTAR
jgi:hypothetical protein